MRRLLSLLRELPAAPPLAPGPALDHLYRRWRTRILLGSLVSYGLFYLCRKNLSAALPALTQELGYSNTQLGKVGGALYVTYGVFKFINGPLGDRANPRLFMSVGLCLTAAMSLLFGCGTALWVLGLAWALNGVFQAMGAPPCAKLMGSWFSRLERGTKTGIWNISHQAGGGLALILAGFLVQSLGWRSAFFVPAAICLAGAIFTLRVLHDRPAALGLPPPDVWRGEHAAGGGGTSSAEGAAARAPAPGFWPDFREHILGNPYLWLNAAACMFVYVVRFGALDWGIKYLVEAKGMRVSGAGLLSSLLEFLGIPGALLAGTLSDRVFGARRAPVNAIYLAMLAGSVALLYSIPRGHPGLDAIGLGLIGFFTYGPQMIIAGVSPIDLTPPRLAATAVGFTGAWSYAGAALSSIVTGYLVDHVGWGGGFAFWAAASVAALLLMLPLWRVTVRPR